MPPPMTRYLIISPCYLQNFGPGTYKRLNGMAGASIDLSNTTHDSLMHTEQDRGLWGLSKSGQALGKVSKISPTWQCEHNDNRGAIV